MLKVTNSAASALAAARDQQGLPDHVGVRIFASAAEPDSTSSYRFGFVDEPLENDQVTEAEGTRVFIAPEVAPSLDNSVLDLQEPDGLVLMPRPNAQ
jgi:iron-sulfur cluster assembly protein